MVEVRLPTVKEHFGAGWVEGLDNFFPDLPPDKRLKVLGLLDACPNPTAVADENGLDWTINRYTECNLVDSLIMERADEVNPDLAKKMRTPYLRPTDEQPKNYDPKAVPKMYKLMVLAGSGPVRYAASRVIIEEFGRNPQWRIGDPRVSKGLHILETSLKESSKPEEFLARLADGVISADADMDAVLSHIFAREFEGEGLMFLAKRLAQSIRKYAPDLWQHYQSLTDEQKKEKGITTASLES